MRTISLGLEEGEDVQDGRGTGSGGAASANKPFCNGSLASIQFSDGFVEFVKLNSSEKA